MIYNEILNSIVGINGKSEGNGLQSCGGAD